ncbi:MAG: DUF2752 domain-containing protein [Planctomycetota bacterium]|nr:DUF2752 domain-containing protein [Planctomycetota bacterium]
MTTHPESPPTTTAGGLVRRRAPTGARLLAAGGAVAGLTVLGLAAWVTPDATGHGTHVQLGLPDCAWAQAFDKPCATCGMTTSFAYASHGNLLGSAKAQPFGFLLAVVTAAGVWGAGHVAVTGSMIGPAAARLLNTKVLWGSIVLLLTAWAYKFVTWTG